MAIYRFSMQMISRSAGKSIIACAAYRAADKLFDEETRRTKNFKWKEPGVVYTEIMLPKNAPAEYADRRTLWNAVQNIEKAKNAQLAREIVVALPNELPRHLQIKYLKEFVQREFVDKGMIADVCIHIAVNHPKRKRKKPQNDHAHILLTTRGLDELGYWTTKERKGYALDENGQRIPMIDPETGLQKVDNRGRKQWKRTTVEANDWNNRNNAEIWREAWADTCNRALAEFGSTQKVDHRSYERQGIDQIATIHEGYAAQEIEARGGVSERCEYNRKVRKANAERAAIKREVADADAEIAFVQKQIEEEKAVQKAAAERAEAAAKAAQAEQKQMMRQYYRVQSDFWPGYRRLLAVLTEELKKAYEDPEQKAAYCELKRAEYVYEHSRGIVGRFLAWLDLAIAKAKAEPGNERIQHLQAERNNLYKLCKDALDLKESMKTAKVNSELTDGLLQQILAQQEYINKQLAAITDEFSEEISAQKEAAQRAFAQHEVYRRTMETWQQYRIEQQKERSEAEQRSRDFGDLIAAQAELIRLAPTGKKESLEAKTKRAAAESRFKDLCRNTPQSDRKEAEKALREARGNVDQAMEDKLNDIYDQISADKKMDGRSKIYR